MPEGLPPLERAVSGGNWDLCSCTGLPRLSGFGLSSSVIINKLSWVKGLKPWVKQELGAVSCLLQKAELCWWIGADVWLPRISAPPWTQKSPPVCVFCSALPVVAVCLLGISALLHGFVLCAVLALWPIEYEAVGEAGACYFSLFFFFKSILFLFFFLFFFSVQGSYFLFIFCYCNEFSWLPIHQKSWLDDVAGKQLKV